MTNTRTASNFLCILDWMLVLRNIQMYPVFDHIFQFILLINTQKNSLKLLEEKASRVLHLRNSISTKLSEINFIICFRPLFINFIIIFRRSILWRQLFRGRLREKAEIVIRRVTSQNCPTFAPTKNIQSIKCIPKIGSS